MAGIKDALKGRQPIIYARVSGKEQKKTLTTQIEDVKQALKAAGVKRKPVVFSEQASGTKRDRIEFQKMLEYASERPGKAAIVVRDTQRFSRNPWQAGRYYDPLAELDIPLISIIEGHIAGTDKTPQPDGDLIMPILTAVGGQEVSLRKQQTLIGTRASAAKGIFAGTPLELYPKEALSPLRELVRYRPLIANGDISIASVSRRLEKSTSWTQKTLKRLSDIEASVSTEGLQKWLDVTDALRAMEQEHGKGFGAGAPLRMKAVRRMTSGYISQPGKFPIPTSDDINEYFKNYKNYQPKRRK